MITRSAKLSAHKISAHNYRLLDATSAHAHIINDYGSTSPRTAGIGIWVGVDTPMPAMPECRNDLHVLVESYLNYVEAKGMIYWKPVQKKTLDNGTTQYEIISDKHIEVTDDISFIYHAEQSHTKGITIETAYSEFEFEIGQYNTWIAGRAMVVETYLGHASATVTIGDKTVNEAFTEAFNAVSKKSNELVNNHKEGMTLTVVFDEPPFDDVNDVIYKDEVAAVRQLDRNIKALSRKEKHLNMIYGSYVYNEDNLTLTVDAVPVIVAIKDKAMDADIDSLIANTKQIAKDNNLELSMSDSCIVKTFTETAYAELLSQPLKLGIIYTLLNNMNGAKAVSIKPTNK